MTRMRKVSRLSIDTLLIVLLFGLMMLPISLVGFTGVRSNDNAVLGVQHQEPAVKTTTTVREELEETADSVTRQSTQSTQTKELTQQLKQRSQKTPN